MLGVGAIDDGEKSLTSTSVNSLKAAGGFETGFNFVRIKPRQRGNKKRFDDFSSSFSRFFHVKSILYHR